MSSYNDLVQFAARNKGEGVLIEPRFYYDILDFPAAATGTLTEVQNSDSDAYKNGEQFPVRLTHMISTALPYFELNSQTAVWWPSQANAHDFFLRVERYGEFYMNERLTRLPAWSNQVVAPSTSLNNGIVTHRFAQPIVLSTRDSFRVELDTAFRGMQTITFPPYELSEASITDPTFTNVTVQFNGVGMRSGRPYVFSGVAREAGAIYAVDPSQLQNTGNEPVAVTEVTVTATVLGQIEPSTESQTAAPTGSSFADTRFFNIQIRQHGNGTQAWWFRGPSQPLLPRMPLALLGTHQNNCVVHKIPGDGLTLEPGELLRVRGATTVEGSERTPPRFPLAVGFAGYLMVT